MVLFVTESVVNCFDNCEACGGYCAGSDEWCSWYTEHFKGQHHTGTSVVLLLRCRFWLVLGSSLLANSE